MLNHTEIDQDGIIRSSMVGDQDEGSISQLIEKTLKLTEQYRRDNPNKPLKFLVDMSKIGKQTLGARQVGLKSLNNLEYEKIALYGANQFIRHIATLVIMASGQGDKVQQFEDEAKAIAWLRT